MRQSLDRAFLPSPPAPPSSHSAFEAAQPEFHPGTVLAGTMGQWLYLQPDGRTVVDEASVRVLGPVAAHLSGRIARETP